MTRRSSLLAGALQNALGGVGRLGFGFVLLLVLGRLLGAAGTGAYLLAAAAAGILEAIAESGPRTATVRYVAYFLARGDTTRARGSVRTALAITMAVGGVLLIAGLLFSDAGTQLFLEAADPAALDERRVMWQLAVISSVPLAITAVLLAATRGTGWMTPSNVTDGLVVPMLRIALFLPLLWLGLGEVASMWAFLGAALAGLAVAWWFARRTLPDKGTSSWEWREIGGYAAAQGGSGILDMALFHADILIVGALLTDADAGLYGGAVRLAAIPILVMVAFNTVFQPRAAALWSTGEHSALEDLYRRITRIVLALSVPLYLLLAAFPGPLLGIFGEEFRSAGTVLVVLALAQIVNSGTGPAGNMLSMAGYPAWNFWNNLVLLILNVGANLILVPRFGIVGAAWAWGTTIVAVNIARLIEVRVLTGLFPYDRRTVRVGLLGAAAAFALFAIRPWSVDTLGAAVAIGAAFGILWLVASWLVLPSDDRALVAGLVRRSSG